MNYEVGTKDVKVISGRNNEASAAVMVGFGSILGRVTPKTIKNIGIHSFPA